MTARWSGEIVAGHERPGYDLAEIRALATRCNAADGLNLKLNWDLMEARAPGEVGDFCAREDGQLVGYVALDGFGTELELTGMVAPGRRRRGICRALVGATLDESRRRGATQVLLVSERASASGRAFAAAIGGRYSSAEYRLEAQLAAGQLPPPGEIALRRAESADVPLLAEIRMRVFGGDEDQRAAEERAAHSLGEAGSRYYLALARGEVVGSTGVILEDGQVYIRGVGILPDYRRRGYGRAMLAATIGALLDEGQTRFALDVATENDRALDLYRSCGFEETNVYEYYELPMTP